MENQKKKTQTWFISQQVELTLPSPKPRSSFKAFRIIRITRIVKAVRLMRIFRFIMAPRIKLRQERCSMV